ncbi:second BRCT domain on nijmegen syndrome breakage protein domain-containing protein [Phthorimaea operculella]|nr:second BRCT domain on nijmegen syndrome breakage protein domain-containing protein [Phthorimaea operculella]
MWYLTSETEKRIIYVVPNKDVTIGRSVDAQVCNFAIPDDASISRKHAILSISESNLYLQDLGSRYGTFINEEKIDSSSKTRVNNNDVIKFGKLTSVWRAHQSNLITCTSTLKGENLQNLKMCLANLGGVLKSEWDDTCAYLTMPAITLTIKVVLALTQGSHIVTTEFWSKCVEAVNSHNPLPDPSKFTPQVVESTLNKESVSFLPNAFRRSLFAGKTIVFFSRKQLEMYKIVLTKCSGNPLLLSDTQMTKSSLCDPNVIVIQYNLSNTSQETQAQKDQITDIINYLKSKGKRVVADAEIGLSILYCSLDKYCNADFNFSSEVVKQNAGQNGKPSNVLAQETQEQTQKMHKDNVVINESLTPTSSKRKFDEEDGIEQANKKFASGPVSSANESTKRKFTDGNESENPSKKLAVGNDDDDLFNFKNASENTNQNSSEKVLNFTKPAQNKQTIAGNDDDDLFNFVQDKAKESGDSANTIFKSENDVDIVKIAQKRKLEDDNVDINALRGSKLKELMENQINSEDYKNVKIKKEEPDELDQKMNDLYLGETIITRKDLIVKKEIIEIEDNEPRGQKNFKKFRKVWPAKSNVRVIPKSTMSIVIPDSVAEEITSQSY